VDIESLRREIPATQQLVYMNTGWSGPSPRCVVEAIKERLEYESYEGPTARPVLESRRLLGQRAREAVAGLLGATAEEVSLTQNTTEGLNIVLNGLGWKAGDEIITCNLEHSSVLVPVFYLKQRRGLQVKVVDLEATDSVEQVLAKFEAACSPRTRLFCLSHIMYTVGLRLPLKEICEIAHRRGALVLVDAAQSVGQVPLNMRELGCDFYAIPGHKWVLGPDGVGALYIKKDLISRLEPMKSGGASAAYDLDGNLTPNSDQIKKFELTTTSGPLWAGLVAAIEFLQGIGQEAIEARVLSLAAQMRGLLEGIDGVSLLSPQGGPLATGLVTFAVQGMTPQEVGDALWERGRIVSRTVSHPQGLRLSLDFFNTEAELDRVADIVGQLARQGVQTV